MSNIQKLITSGKLADRGLKSEDEVLTIVGLVNNEDKSAAQALISVINCPDTHKDALTPVEICRIFTNKEKGCLEKLLHMGFHGDISIHFEVKKTEIEKGELIGKGKAGMVYQGTYNGKKVAIKMFNNPEKIEDKEFQKELIIMSLIREPALVLPCYGGSSKKGNKFIIIELMETTIYELLHDKSVEITPQLRVIMAISIARSMSFLHSCNLIHRDLKSLNLLVNQYFEIKICDFGLTRVIDTSAQMTANIGTVCWIAPEIFNNKKAYSEKADVYSYGVILWELTTRLMPFDDTEAFSIPVLVTKGKRPKIPKTAEKTWSKLIKKCWNQNPKKRPSFDEALEQLKEIYNQLCAKNPEYNKEVAFKLTRKGDTFKLTTLEGAEAKKAGFPSHTIWKPNL